MQLIGWHLQDRLFDYSKVEILLQYINAIVNYCFFQSADSFQCQEGLLLSHKFHPIFTS